MCPALRSADPTAVTCTSSSTLILPAPLLHAPAQELAGMDGSINKLDGTGEVCNLTAITLILDRYFRRVPNTNSRRCPKPRGQWFDESSKSPSALSLSLYVFCLPLSCLFRQKKRRRARLEIPTGAGLAERQRGRAVRHRRDHCDAGESMGGRLLVLCVRTLRPTPFTRT